MATPMVLTSCRIFAGGLDLTGYSNKTELSAEVEEKDVTTFNSGGWKECKGGLASATVKGGGHWEAGDQSIVDDSRWTNLAAVIPHSVYPADANDGSLGYFTSVLSKSYSFGGAVGDVNTFTIDDSSSWPVVRGVSLEPPGTARIVTGVGTGQQISAVSASQHLYGALHVLSIAGTVTPTITARIESDVDNTFATPTTQIQFAAATAISGEILRTAGAITDTWFRAAWTISGTNPSFLFVVSAGVAI